MFGHILIMAGKIIFSLYYIPAIKCDFESSVKWHYSKVYKLRRKKLGILNCCLFSLLQLIFLPYPLNEHIYNLLWRCCANQTSFDAKRQNAHWILKSKLSSYLNWKFEKIQMYLEIKQKNTVCVWPEEKMAHSQHSWGPNLPMKPDLNKMQCWTKHRCYFCYLFQGLILGEV